MASSEEVEVKRDDDEFVRLRRSHFYAFLIPLAFVTGLALGYAFWGQDAGAGPDQLPESIAAAPEQPSTPRPTVNPSDLRLDVSVDDDPAIGPEGAPITIIEFSDFSCQFCKRFHQETFQALMDAYPDQIRFVYRDFPVVGGGATGLAAAQAADCAGEQGSFWEYHDALFSGDYGQGRQAYITISEDLGIDSAKFEECLDNERYAEEVQKDRDYAFSLGVNATPSFFINGIPFIGAQPLANFKQVIDAELANQ